MKFKAKIALILGAVGSCILIVSLIVTSVGKEKPAPQQEVPENSESITNNEESAAPNDTTDQMVPEETPSTDEQETGDVSNKEEPADKEEEPVVEKPSEDKPDTNSNSTNVEKPSSNDEPVASSGLNPDPQTKEEIEAVLNNPYMLLVNRSNKVSSDYVGSNLVTYSGDYKLNSTCADALRKLIRAGKNAGYNFVLYSGYRSYSSQYNKYYNKIAYWENQGKSKDEAIRLTDQYYAPPGASEHHTGLAADVCIPEIVNKYACLHENYEYTDAFKWFSSHAHEYGFILRYPKGDEDITGYNYEPWHYRYVGVEVATEIYRRGITFEEYISDLQRRLSALGA